MKTCYGIVGDTLNRIAHAIDRSEIDWVHVRHEEAGAFAAGAEALLTGRFTACDGTCGPGSLHFINGLYEANRNGAPVILIATQVVRQDIGFESMVGMAVYTARAMLHGKGHDVWRWSSRTSLTMRGEHKARGACAALATATHRPGITEGAAGTAVSGAQPRRPGKKMEAMYPFSWRR